MKKIELKTKNFEIGLKIFLAALLILSLFFLITSVYTLLLGKNFNTIIIYSLLSKYSGLYKFTFIVLALYVTLKQLKESQRNNETTLSQLKSTQADIIAREEKEKRNETLIQCNYYFTEIQKMHSELSSILIGLPIFWPFSNSITNEVLRKNDSLFKKVSEITETHKKEILLALYKIEALSASFIHGELDLDVGGRIIGPVFYKQIEFLFTLIAVFRENDDSIFCINTISLYNKWKRMSSILEQP